MSKIQVTTALERQIPEFIREDYTTFVKFVKAYYEFLAQSGDRNLEDLRSIDRTLDEFVSKFKKELAAIFPTGTMPSERVFLEHISDFYNSRGSVESYQLLFRVLFNKDADIFYPSTQILKMSDGKWIQEKSVFVRVINGNLFDLKGQIIKITTSKKSIDVFCPNVVLYRDDIYEVFLDKQYYSDINIGDIVSLNGANGIILPCPAKYKIVKEGKGFEIGSIYNLPTAEGNGSVVKVTRIGSLGEIKAIQIISFGLDYKTNFYAQLSNKTTQALVYYHPITEFIAGFPREYPLLEPTSSYGPNPPSADPISDYVGYGYFISQNYFYYDPSYVAVEYNPLTSPEQSDMLETVWFADTTYVGDIIASFYTNEAGVVIDEDTAEIKIELGSVAVYPGYYASNDGFISDESYLHDGDYYQLFSYVVKVEEKLEDYKEIVKTLLQPAGLKLFGEYNIYKNFDVVATPLLAFIRRQLFDQIYQFGDYYNGEIQKHASDLLASQYTEFRVKDIFKTYNNDMSMNETLFAKDINKPILEDHFIDFIDNDISSKDVTKPIIEIIASLEEVVTKSLDRINQDYITAVEAIIAKQVFKTIDPEFISNLLDNNFSNIGLNKNELTELDEYILISIIYSYTDKVNLLELFSNNLSRGYEEDITVYDVVGNTWGFGFIEPLNMVESYSALSTYIRNLVESLIVSEVKQTTVNKTYYEIISTFIEAVTIGRIYDRLLEETINNFIEGSTLYFNPFSAATITGIAADRFFAEEYAVITTSTIT